MDRESRSFRAGLPVYGVMMVQSLLASGTHIVAKAAVQGIDPFVLTLLRGLTAAAVLVPVLLIRGKVLRFSPKDIKGVLWLGLLSVPINQFSFLYGLGFTSPSNAALLYATTPIVVLVLGWFVLGEPMTRRKVLGVILGFVGVTIVILERSDDAGSSPILGNAIIFAGVISWAAYSIMSKPLVHRLGALEVSGSALAVGVLLFLPIAALPASHFPFDTLGGVQWFQVLYLGLGTSVIAYSLWTYAIGRLDVAKVALFANLQPVLTALLAFFILDQPVPLQLIVGGTIALAGVVLAQFG